MAKRHKFLVLTNPVEGREREYNTWYDNVHVPDVLKVPGVVAAQRFGRSIAGADPRYGYMAIYELETDDPQAVIADIRSRAGTPAMEMSEALDTADIYAEVYEAHAPEQKA